MPTVRRSHPVRLLATAVLALALLAGAAACSGDDSPAAPPETAPETTVAVPEVQGVRVATAKGPTLLVRADPPPELGAVSTTTTTTAPGARAPIPRVGLNSAGVTKVDQGFEYENPTYFGNPLVLVVTEDHGDWLKVMVPARPNQTEGWVAASDVELTTNPYRMVLSLADFHLTVYEGEQVIAETDVVVGKETTPTPVGSFYLNEKIQQPNPDGFYGPWVLSTNGYSEALDLFDDGLPVIAFHGTNQPELVGTRSSNGCIRVPNDVITRLAEVLPAGTPIEIVAESSAAASPGTSLATAA